jgi:hypothetical protein
MGQQPYASLPGYLKGWTQPSFPSPRATPPDF